MYDIAIIGGGINGCGIARDAAGRGLSVLLAEKGDLAGATSSASTKLIHGGLRYLEQLRFGLVRESLREREVLLRIAPHLVTPLRFVLPVREGLRSSLLIRLGLFLYDHLDPRQTLPRSGAIDLAAVPAGRPLKPGFRRGFEYSDCRVDDARLVVLNAMDAAARGARICVRTETVSAHRQHRHWRIVLKDIISGRTETADARALVNAGGAWVADIAAHRVEARTVPRVRLVRGSHIVVRRLFDHDSAYILQNDDRRVVFAIPYEHDFTLIGTTDVDCAGAASEAIGDSEIAYLCAAVNAYFATPIAPADVVWSFSGVRALADAGHGAAQDAARDVAIAVEGGDGEPLLVSVVGGKITTYRRVAEEVLRRLAPVLPANGPPWTHSVPLPGGEMGGRSTAELAAQIMAACPALEPVVAERVAASYGTAALTTFAGARREQDLGIHFGAGLHQREVEYLVASEWARTAEDILWRRTKLGLRLDPAGQSRLSGWLQERAAQAAATSG